MVEQTIIPCNAHGLLPSIGDEFSSYDIGCDGVALVDDMVDLYISIPPGTASVTPKSRSFRAKAFLFSRLGLRP